MLTSFSASPIDEDCAPPPETRFRAIALVRPSLQETVASVARSVHCDVEFVRDAALFASRIESEEPQCVLLDAGATSGAADMLRFVRSLWPRAVLIVIVRSWCDEEVRIRTLASAVLHTPVRPGEWIATLDRLLRQRAQSIDEG